jgi:hypothetical protein
MLALDEVRFVTTRGKSYRMRRRAGDLERGLDDRRGPARDRVHAAPQLPAGFDGESEIRPKLDPGMGPQHEARAAWPRRTDISLPCGHDGHGLLIGLQIVGRSGDEQLVLSAAHHHQAASGRRNRHPL